MKESAAQAAGMDCPAGIEIVNFRNTPLAVIPQCKEGLPLPIESRAEWRNTTATTTTPGETVPTVNAVVSYSIKRVVEDPKTHDIGVVTTITPNAEAFNQVVGRNEQGQPTDKPEDLTFETYSQAMVQKLGQEVCAADLNLIVDVAQRSAGSLVEAGQPLTPDAVRAAESFYDLDGHGGTAANNKSVPNILVVFDTGQQGEDVNGDGQPDGKYTQILCDPVPQQ